MNLDKNWEQIYNTLDDAVSVSWDECHKIYISLDETQHALQIEYGYDVTHRIDEIGRDLAYELLQEWYENGCGLEFVNSIRTVEGNPIDGFTQLIPQFARDDDEQDEVDGWQ